MRTTCLLLVAVNDSTDIESLIATIQEDPRVAAVNRVDGDVDLDV